MNFENPEALLASPILYLKPLGKTPTDSQWHIQTQTHKAEVSSVWLAEHRVHFKRSNLIAIFDYAKPALKSLLVNNVDVARPVCLQTLQQICAVESPLKNPFEQLESLMASAETNQCKGLVRLECLVLRAFAALEHHGLYIDAAKWAALISVKREEATRAAKLCEEILAPYAEKDLFGGTLINLGHAEEMRLLFEKVLGQPFKGLGNAVLSSLSHPLAKAFLSYREASKIVSTYGDHFLEHVNAHTGRIHADFIPLGSSTGRVSCQSPNLQNLPSEPAFEDCLQAPLGRALIRADFSACELRVLAGLAQDPHFLAAINSDDDFHSVIASQLFETPVSKTQNSHLRNRAKAINFGIIYGMGARGLARSLDLSEDEAQTILSRYFLRFPHVKEYLEACVTSAKRLGYAKTLLGRRLYFNDELAKEGSDISRIAKNMPIQGTAAELAKLAMTRVHERLSAEFKDAFLVNMIHDELVVECAKNDLPSVSQVVKEEMLGAQEALFDKVRPEVEIYCS